MDSINLIQLIIFVIVCVCVCVTERERERALKTERKKARIVAHDCVFFQITDLLYSYTMQCPSLQVMSVNKVGVASILRSSPLLW